MKPVIANAGAAPMHELVVFREDEAFVEAARKLARAEGYPLAAILRGLLRDWVEARLATKGGEDGDSRRTS